MPRIKNGGKLLKRDRTVLLRRHNFKDCNMMTVAKSPAPASYRKCDNFEAGSTRLHVNLRYRQCLGESDGHDDHWRYCSHKLVPWKAMRRHRSRTGLSPSSARMRPAWSQNLMQYFMKTC